LREPAQKNVPIHAAGGQVQIWVDGDFQTLKGKSKKAGKSRDVEQLETVTSTMGKAHLAIDSVREPPHLDNSMKSPSKARFGAKSKKEMRKYSQQEQDRHGNYMIDDDGIHNEFDRAQEFTKSGAVAPGRGFEIRKKNLEQALKRIRESAMGNPAQFTIGIDRLDPKHTGSCEQVDLEDFLDVLHLRLAFPQKMALISHFIDKRTGKMQPEMLLEELGGEVSGRVTSVHDCVGSARALHDPMQSPCRAHTKAYYTHQTDTPLRTDPLLLATALVLGSHCNPSASYRPVACTASTPFPSDS